VYGRTQARAQRRQGRALRFTALPLGSASLEHPVTGLHELGAKQQMVDAGGFCAKRGLFGSMAERSDGSYEVIDALIGISKFPDEYVIEGGVKGRLAHDNANGKHSMCRIRAPFVKEKKERGGFCRAARLFEVRLFSCDAVPCARHPRWPA
jgi:hypothetical protein